jgi:hypothetical protein
MRTLALLITLLASAAVAAQLPEQYKTGINAEQNIVAIGKLNPNAPGGTGFDERYQGVKGSPLLFDSLLVSWLKIKGQSNYIQIETDLNVLENELIYRNPSNRRIFSIDADKVNELFVRSGDGELYFRTTGGLKFAKAFKETRFCQVLYKGKAGLLKLPEKIYVKADYRGAYTADRRYDEFKTEYRYFVNGPDSLYHQVNLSKKAISKIYPDREKEIAAFDEKPFADNKEEMVISLLKTF